ncbi:hypothetical protein PR202_ga20586 [Eleusine coracana subsp. coracana]|uniref:GED domain-containing protein n=1 Tax=Eleusine coracana subsp. coracana TaxID=191504 RepID=A0AAV5CYB1_ELECO|nr:hypothetical protein PR202_ga20586 [Eleusine coracana subsp. coracana]
MPCASSPNHIAVSFAMYCAVTNCAVTTLVYLVQMDYINTSHPNFVGGSKVIELAKHEALPSKASTSVSGHKDGALVGSDTQLTAERSQKSRAIFPRDSTRGAPPGQPDMTTGTGGSQIGNSHGGNSSVNTMPQVRRLEKISSMIQLNEVRLLSDVNPMSLFLGSESRKLGFIFFLIQSDFSPCLYQPPITLKSYQPEQDVTEIAIMKLLIKSYYDIVRKNIEDAVPKAVMHFLVGLFIRLLCIVILFSNGPFYLRDNLLNELMKETDEVLIRRKRIQETLEVLEQAHRDYWAGNASGAVNPASSSGHISITVPRVLFVAEGSESPDDADYSSSAAAVGASQLDAVGGGGGGGGGNDTLVWVAMHDCRMLLGDCDANVEQVLSNIAYGAGSFDARLRTCRPGSARSSRSRGSPIGLDLAAIASYPKIPFSSTGPTPPPA